MGIGVILPIAEDSAFGDETPHFADILAMTRVAEDVGFDAVWIIDHFLFRAPARRASSPGARDADDRGVWECFTTMAGLASATERIQIGSLVACTGFRNPGLVAKMTETIDDISGGRVILGLGAGWHEPEYDAFGYPFDHRVSRFEEAMAHHRSRCCVTDTPTSRASSSRPTTRSTARADRAPPGRRSWSAAAGQRMLRIIARYADAWNTVWHGDPDAIVRADGRGRRGLPRGRPRPGDAGAHRRRQHRHARLPRPPSRPDPGQRRGDRGDDRCASASWASSTSWPGSIPARRRRIERFARVIELVDAADGPPQSMLRSIRVYTVMHNDVRALRS